MRWIGIALWTAFALAATGAMGLAGAKAGRWPEELHLLGHLALCGGIAAATAWTVPGSPTRRAGAGLAAGLLLGAGIEVVQARFHPVLREAAFDMGIDLLSALAGTLAVGRLDPGPGHLTSAVLHPQAVVAAGLAFALGLPWTLAALLAGLPAVALWLSGVAGGRFTDADVSHRPQRTPLVAVGLLSATAFLALAHGGPPEVQGLARVLLLGGLLGAVLTVGGLKVSGHVAIPAALALWAMHVEPRAALGWLGAAALLSWARWTAGRHQPHEVAAAWLLAATTALTTY